MLGNVLIQFNNENKCLLIGAGLTKGRSVQPPEVESSVVGPKQAFVESIDINLNLLRRRIPHPNFCTEEILISEFTKVRVAICYIEGITNTEYIQTMTQRLKDINFDFITDSTQLSQMIEENSKSIFPQLVETERPDRVAALLLYGQLAVLVDGSSNAILGPSNLGSFFIAYEDYYLPWNLASFFRLIRLFAVLFSVFSTSIYVAILTYHFQIIPNNLLVTIISSRIKTLIHRRLTERLEILKEVIVPSDQIVVLESYEDGAALFEATKNIGLEGIVSKLRNSPYFINKRDDAWLKVKNYEFDVVNVVSIRKGDFGWGLSQNGKYVGITELVPADARKALWHVAKQIIEKEDKQYVYLKPHISIKVKSIGRTSKGYLRTPSFVDFVLEEPSA